MQGGWQSWNDSRIQGWEILHHTSWERWFTLHQLGKRCTISSMVLHLGYHMTCCSLLTSGLMWHTLRYEGCILWVHPHDLEMGFLLFWWVLRSQAIESLRTIIVVPCLQAPFRIDQLWSWHSSKPGNQIIKDNLAFLLSSSSIQDPWDGKAKCCSCK